MRYSSQYQSDPTPARQAREALSQFDNPKVPNLLEEAYNQALAVGREIEEEMDLLTRELTEGEALKKRIDSARAERGVEELTEDVQLAYDTIGKVQEWTEEPQISVWKKGPVKTVEDMEKLLSGIREWGLDYEGLEESHSQTRQEIHDSYGIQVAPIFGTCSKHGPVYTAKTYPRREDQRVDEVLEAAVGAGQAALYADSAAELKRLKQALGRAAGRVKGANWALTPEAERLEDEEAMSQKARRYLEEIPEL